MAMISAQPCPACKGKRKDARGKWCKKCAGTGVATDWTKKKK